MNKFKKKFPVTAEGPVTADLFLHSCIPVAVLSYRKKGGRERERERICAGEREGMWM